MFTFMELDDFIPDYYQKSIEDYMLRSQIWGFDNNVSGMDQRKINLPQGINISSNQDGFSSMIYSKEFSWKTEERLFAMMQPMIHKVMSIFPIDLEIHRVRGGLSTIHSDGGIHFPHVDFPFPHYTFLYYVNDSDGDTILFNEKFDINKDVYDQHDDFTIFKSFTPKRGKAILFNGLTYHSSSNPQHHESRVVINMNLIPVSE